MTRTIWLLAALAAAPSVALAEEGIGTLRLEAPGFAAQSTIPERFAFCRPDGNGQAEPAANLSPEIRWSGAPSGARSYAVAMLDPDVPADLKDVNTAGKVIDAGSTRTLFYQWLLVDLPSGMNAFVEGSDSRGVTPRGKPITGTASGRRGVNDYTSFLASDAAMKGVYAGYNGPCPPWNDARLHHYTLTVCAVDIPRLDLPAPFDGRNFELTLRGHVLTEATLTRTYSTRSQSAQ